MFGSNYLEKLRRIKKTSEEQGKNYFIKVYSHPEKHTFGFGFIFSVRILISKVCFSQPLNVVE